LFLLKMGGQGSRGQLRNLLILLGNPKAGQFATFTSRDRV
jgi:hypothetical protein